MEAMQEMAREYCKAAAKLVMRMREKERQGTLTKAERNSIRRTLAEIREVQQLLDGYYTAPRPEGISAANWKARRTDDIKS